MQQAAGYLVSLTRHYTLNEEIFDATISAGGAQHRFEIRRTAVLDGGKPVEPNPGRAGRIWGMAHAYAEDADCSVTARCDECDRHADETADVLVRLLSRYPVH